MIEGPDEKGNCWPVCVFFKCGDRHIRLQGEAVKCAWLNDDCMGSSCSFAICVRGKMMSGNRCGFTVRRLTVEPAKPEEIKLDPKLKGKLSKRIKDLDELI